MMLRERTAVPDEALPLARFRDHLQLGSGFADIGAGDAALIGYLRAAIAAIEGRTAKALISHGFTLTLTHWRGDGQPLPLAPVSAVEAVRLIDEAGTTVLDPAGYRLMKDGVRPRLMGLRAVQPDFGRQIEVDFIAGFGALWGDVPADLCQAVLLLAAQYYELRHDSAAEAGAMPFGVTALIERWRTVRLLGGRG